jgi:hypothetical protein
MNVHYQDYLRQWRLWLSLLKYIGFDNEEEYKQLFKKLVNNCGINKNNSTPFNPQSNGIVEKVNLTLNDVLITAEIDGRELDDKDPRGLFLSSAAYAIRSNFHATLKSTLGQVVFGRDMVLPINFMADWG